MSSDSDERSMRSRWTAVRAVWVIVIGFIGATGMFLIKKLVSDDYMVPTAFWCGILWWHFAMEVDQWIVKRGTGGDPTISDGPAYEH